METGQSKAKGVAAHLLRNCWVRLERIDEERTAVTPDLDRQKEQEQPSSTTHPGPDRPFKCSRCDKAFRRPDHLKVHESAVHDKKKSYTCEYDGCSKTFTQHGHKNRHEELHQDKRYSCGFCSKRFHREDVLVIHSRTHTGERPFTCEHCSATFATAQRAYEHEHYVHEIRKQYACRFCDTKFTRLKSRHTHEKLQHKKIGLACKYCTKLCSRPSQLLRHEKIHTGERAEVTEKAHGCSYCPKRFTRESVLQIHVRGHTGEKPYKCDECSMAFESSTALTAHKAVHRDDQSYSCVFCGKTFRSLDGKKEHEKYVCPKNPNKVMVECKLECQDCGQRFRRQSQLQIHVRRHTGERPFRCDLCCKSFISTAGFFNHQRTHTGEKPYTCRHCKKSFSYSSSRDKHEKTHAGEKINTARRLSTHN